MATPSFIDRLEEHRDRCYTEMPLVTDLLTGTLDHASLRQHARRHFAEVWTFINFKLPCRMRLCPHEAVEAKRFFWELYAEEHGQFRDGHDHAELFRPLCHQLGLTDAELEAEVVSYLPNYEYMLSVTPSREALVRELATAYAWESVIIKLGAGLLQALKTHYSFREEDLTYFVAHSAVDESHSNEARRLLQLYVTEPVLEDVAMDAVTDTLLHRNPFSL